jgi:hypothetical protein
MALSAIPTEPGFFSQVSLSMKVKPLPSVPA